VIVRYEHANRSHSRAPVRKRPDRNVPC
jgi:hypothetical protein